MPECFDVAELAIALEHLALGGDRTAYVKDSDEIGLDRVDSRWNRRRPARCSTASAAARFGSPSRDFDFVVRTRNPHAHGVAAGEKSRERAHALRERMESLDRHVAVRFRPKEQRDLRSGLRQRVAQRGKTRVDFRERNENEGAFAQARMRNAADPRSSTSSSS